LAPAKGAAGEGATDRSIGSVTTDPIGTIVHATQDTTAA
jgi:hypothetical protein